MKDNKRIGMLKVYSNVPKKFKLEKMKVKKVLGKTILFLTSALAILGTIPATVYTVETANQVLVLKDYGVSTSDAIYASLDDNYIQPELKETVQKMDEILEERFPNVEFNNSGSVVLSSSNWDDKDNSLDTLAGLYIGDYDVAIFNKSHPNKQAHENLHRRFRHTIVNSNNEKEEYNGLERTMDGKGDKLAEALTTYLEQELYGTEPCYIEYKYLKLMFYFIPEEELVKIAAEKGMEDLEMFFSRYFDCDIVDLIDKTPGVNEIFVYGKDYVVDGLNYRANVITDAFYKWINNSNLSEEEKQEKINSYYEYLSENFVNATEHFEQVFDNYHNSSPTK